MGKLDAILATYASVYGAMKRKEKLVARKETRKHLSASAGDIHGEVSSTPSATVVAASSSSSSSSSSSAPEVPPTLSSGANQSKASTVNHLSVLRDTQRLWMSATAEHRAALEIIAESQYCRGIYPQLRQRLPHVPQYCTMTLNYLDDDDTDATTSMDDTLKKYDKYQDPSKKYALRLPLYKEAMFRKEPISMDADDVDDAGDGDDGHDDGSITNNDLLRKLKAKHSSSTVKKKQRNKAYRMIRISKKEALLECLRRQPHVLRALQQAKRRPARPLTSTAQERPPLVFIDWTKVPRPTRQTAPTADQTTTKTAGSGRSDAKNSSSSSGRSSGRSSSSGSGRSSRRPGAGAEEEASKSPGDEDDDGDDSGSPRSQTSGSPSVSHHSHGRSTGRSRRPRHSSATGGDGGGGSRRPSSESDVDDDDDEGDEGEEDEEEDTDDEEDEEEEEEEEDEEEINIL